MTKLKQAAVTGTFWSAVATVLSRGLRFATTIVLARLLAPADFGVFAMAVLVMDIAEMLRDLGLGAALIQRKHLEPQHLSTCFWANEAIGACLWVATLALAPLAAGFYRNPEIQPVLSVLALNFLISPLGSIPWVLLNRELRFKELMMAQTVATAVRGAASLSLALAGFGVWSLVWGPLISTAVGSFINWRFCSWRPTLLWSWPHFSELLRFGKGIFGGRLLGYFSANSDYLVTGRVLGAQTLGYYNFAYELPHLAETHLVPVINRVLFPVLSQVQDDVERLRRGYLQSMRWIAMVSVPFAFGLCAVAPEFIPILYGSRWSPVILPLQILCWAGLAHALTSTVWTVQQAAGRSAFGFWWNAATLPLTVGSLIISVRGGMTAVAMTMGLLAVVLSASVQHITNRMIGLSWRRFLQTLYLPVAASLVMAAVIFIMRRFLLSAGSATWVVLVVSVLAGKAVYLAVLVAMNRGLIKEVKSLMPKGQGAAAPIEPQTELKAGL